MPGMTDVWPRAPHTSGGLESTRRPQNDDKLLINAGDESGTRMGLRDVRAQQRARG